MDFYLWNFAVLALLNVLLAYREYRVKKTSQPQLNDAKRQVAANDAKENLKSFKWRFLPVYLLVNGADWLQGPYIYPLYKDEKKLAEEVVAALFMTGFIAGAVSASFTGKLADRFGRRLACLAFCVIYSLSCLVLFSNDIIVLFVGRALGGVSTTILYSCFESWMVTEYNVLFPDEPPSTLSGIFSTMTTLNSVVAVLSGILAEWFADLAGTQKAPFMSAIGCLALAFMIMWKNWGENYGTATDVSLLLEGKEQPPPKSTLRLFLDDKRLLALGLTSSVFEGSMYVFIFFKFPALKLSHELAGLGSGEDLPFGLIFAILMCSMMAGSMIHKYIVTNYTSVAPATLLVMTLSIGAASFMIPVLIRNEHITFWSFCVFEVCCGIYFPLMAYQKGKIIDDSVRANVYGLMRVPLNAFVVLILSTTKEGARHRDLVFTVCSALLLISTAVNGVWL
ncbi:MFS general substrate transporter [Venustampulla echinocandica]|uniref:Molybdate-anion transporter n=1 Tax=Venustampulla echinocandica TaxID=2656787 RepID=A0A370TT14_9HELO|nr:MFS general substrate transporter [Venustampulla echinocandica]RDL38672.1 MFS general substrate transporter [Venustampulla echinocandica]